MITAKENVAILKHQRSTRKFTWLLWIYLLLIALAEILISFVNPQSGQIIHTLLLVVLLIHGSIDVRIASRQFALALMLVPLIRILSLSLPLTFFPQIAWLAVIGTPLLVATWIVIRNLRLPPSAIGLQFGNPIMQLMLGMGGLGLGAIEYAILKPAPLINDFSWEKFWISALILTIFTGILEEVIFRGVLQFAGMRVLQHWGLVYVSLLFAVLHIGYRSLTDFYFVLGVGLLFAYIVRRSGSLLGVTVAHSLTNITLFLIIPYLLQHPAHPGTTIFFTVTWAGTGLALCALVILIIRPSRTKPSSEAHASATVQLSGSRNQ